jgi:hypothetical protein
LDEVVRASVGASVPEEDLDTSTAKTRETLRVVTHEGTGTVVGDFGRERSLDIGRRSNGSGRSQRALKSRDGVLQVDERAKAVNEDGVERL